MLSSLILALAALTQIQSGDGLSQASILRAYNESTPAICLVTYSAEVTNPNSGETSKRDSSALGLVVTPAGLVMAPGHMALENAEPFNINVSIGQGDSEQKYEAKLLKKPEDINVCFLRVQSDQPLNLPCIRFTRGVRLGLGEPLLLIGVMSETLDFARGTFTCRVGAVLESPRTTYCIDGALRFGFVGGPVINAQGRTVGVVGFDLTPLEGGDIYVRSGQPLVYQADLFQKYIDAPPSEKNAEARGEDAWLGVFSQPLTDDFAEYWGLPKKGGIIISSLMPGAPGDTAGLKPGDVVVSFNNTPVLAKQDREVVHFTKLVRDAGIGNTVPMRVLRNGQPMDFQVTLKARPKPSRQADEFKDEVLGLTVREITTDVRIALNLGEDVKGVIIRRVRSGSMTDLARMRPGVIILKLGGEAITSLDDYKRVVERIAAEKPKEIATFCRAGTETGFFRLEPRWDK